MTAIATEYERACETLGIRVGAAGAIANERYWVRVREVLDAQDFDGDEVGERIELLNAALATATDPAMRSATVPAAETSEDVEAVSEFAEHRGSPLLSVVVGFWGGAFGAALALTALGVL